MPTPTATPLVTVRPASTDDTGPRHVVVIAGMDGPSFATPALAELYASQLSAALAAEIQRTLAASWAGDSIRAHAIARRAESLRSDRATLDAITGRCVGPTGGGIAVLRWICEGAERPGEEPVGLDRLITAAGAAIVCGEEGSTDGE